MLTTDLLIIYAHNQINEINYSTCCESGNEKLPTITNRITNSTTLSWHKHSITKL